MFLKCNQASFNLSNEVFIDNFERSDHCLTISEPDWASRRAERLMLVKFEQLIESHFIKLHLKVDRNRFDVLIFKTCDCQSKAVILKKMKCQTTLIVHELDGDFILEKAHRQSKQLDIQFVTASCVIDLILVFLLIIIVTIHLTFVVGLIGLLSNTSQEGKDADSDEICEGLNQF